VSRARAAGLTLATALALAACGVKAPPRPSGAPDKEPPNAVFMPAEGSDRPGPEVPASAPAPAPAEEPAR
jgi:hypothetical protein